ncbi:uncharacterized protein LOC111083367 [Limulus polyphemus]|uniref:Uncharacterized protein LOC111083367 n=1 Tax=Limulus polyphemus TaxID=6850 RepID=A0ABM1RW17_LIMPO|nr:uncharacterized protein LOC111083367 [Limulus polyphemus]
MAKVEFQRREATKRIQSSAVTSESGQTETLLRSSSIAETEEEKASTGSEELNLSQIEAAVTTPGETEKNVAIHPRGSLEQKHKSTNTVHCSVEDIACQTDFLLNQSVQTILERRRTVTFFGDISLENLANGSEKTTTQVNGLPHEDSEIDQDRKPHQEKAQEATLFEEADQTEKTVEDSQVLTTHISTQKTKATRVPPCGPELQPGSPVLIVNRKEKLSKKENLCPETVIAPRARITELEELVTLSPVSQETQGKEKSSRRKFSLPHLRLMRKSGSQDSDTSSPSPSSAPSVGEKSQSPNKSMNGRKSFKFPSLKRKRQSLPQSSSLDAPITFTSKQSEYVPDISGPLRVSSPKERKAFIFPDEKEGRSHIAKLS